MMVSPLSAQDSDNEISALQKSYIVKNDDYKQSLTAHINKINQKTSPQCDGDINIKRLTPLNITPAEFVTDVPISELAKQHPFFGQWIERAIVTSCGKKNQMNVLTVAYNNTKVANFYPLLNGKTKVEPTFQLRAEDKVIETLPLTEECTSKDDAKIITTHFLGYRDRNKKALSQDNTYFGWFELWSVENCGMTHNVNLAVLPDQDRKFRFVPQLKSE